MKESLQTIEAFSFFQEQSESFVLCNKDTVLAEFHVEGKGVLESVVIDKQFVKLPYWIGDVGAFIENRKAPKKRENIEKLLKISGCDTLLGWLSITHALTLIDTYWVKPKESKLDWKKVSLYTHEFNEVVAKTAFEGGLHGMNLSTTSPEYGTDGTFAKCWIREKEIIKLLKKGSSGARNAGLEPFSEFYTSQIAKELGLQHVEYGLRSRSGKVCSVCDAFTSESIGYVPFAAIDRDSQSLQRVLQKMAVYGLQKEMIDMFIFDAVIFNEDRHKGNFGVLINNDTQEVVDAAPLFDHNISMLCYAEEEDFSNLPKYLEEKGPRIGTDFVEDAKALLYPEMRKKLQRLLGFSFERHPKMNLPEERLVLLEKAINRQIQLILK